MLLPDALAAWAGYRHYVPAAQAASCERFMRTLELERSREVRIQSGIEERFGFGFAVGRALAEEELTCTGKDHFVPSPDPVTLEDVRACLAGAPEEALQMLAHVCGGGSYIARELGEMFGMPSARARHWLQRFKNVGLIKAVYKHKCFYYSAAGVDN